MADPSPVLLRRHASIDLLVTAGRTSWMVKLAPLAIATATIAAMGCASAGVAGPSEAELAGLPPYGNGAVVGEPYEYLLYTHCGTQETKIDGVVWESVASDDGRGNVPRGLGDPYDEGTLLLTTDDTATYTTDAGKIWFERTNDERRTAICK